MKYYFWLLSNIYGRLFAREWLSGFHHVLLNLSLHGLGYDNGYWSKGTGEEYLIEEVLRKGNIRISIDIGANVGMYSRNLLEKTNTIVYAVEPLRSSYEALLQLEALYPNRITTIHGAIGNMDGTATVYSKGLMAETASLSPEVLSHIEIKEEVNIEKLDTLVQRLQIPHIDFIKIDTEGFEKEVLTGMENILQDYKPKYIQFEFNLLHLYRKYTLLDLTDLLKGYEFYRLLPSGMLKINPRKFSSNIYMFSNVLAVRLDNK